MVFQKKIISKNYMRGFHLITDVISKVVSEWSTDN